MQNLQERRMALFQEFSIRVNKSITQISSRRLSQLSTLSPLTLNLLLSKQKRSKLLQVMMEMLNDFHDSLGMFISIGLAHSKPGFAILLRVFGEETQSAFNRLEMIVEGKSITFATPADVLLIAHPEYSQVSAQNFDSPKLVNVEQIISNKYQVDPSSYLTVLKVIGNKKKHSKESKDSRPYKAVKKILNSDSSLAPSITIRKERKHRLVTQTNFSSVIQVKRCPIETKERESQGSRFRIKKHLTKRPTKTFDNLNIVEAKSPKIDVKKFRSENYEIPQANLRTSLHELAMTPNEKLSMSKNERLLFLLKQTNIKLFGKSTPDNSPRGKKMKSSNNFDEDNGVPPRIPSIVWPCFIFKKKHPKLIN